MNSTNGKVFERKVSSEELLEKWYERLKDERIKFVEVQKKEESREESLIMYLEQTNRTSENV